MSAPRYFTARSDASPETASFDEIAHALDVFVVERDGAAPVEWVVGLDAAGTLVAQVLERERTLCPAVRAQLIFHEQSGRRARTLGWEAFHLLEVGGIESVPDVPGADDPVQIHGTLVEMPPPDRGQPRRVEGQLTVTRGDILHALVMGARDAFLYADAGTGRAARTFHMLLPADRPDELTRGRGAVLAYPVLGRDTGVVGPGNEALVDEVLYQLLNAAWQDLVAEDPFGETPEREIPVPSRALVKQRLLTAGFRIEGSQVIPPGGGLLSRLGLAPSLPREGTTDEFLLLAEEVIETLPGWPPERIRALASRVRSA
jgi:hypothetical protein